MHTRRVRLIGATSAENVSHEDSDDVCSHVHVYTWITAVRLPIPCIVARGASKSERESLELTPDFWSVSGYAELFPDGSLHSYDPGCCCTNAWCQAQHGTGPYFRAVHWPASISGRPIT